MKRNYVIGEILDKATQKRNPIWAYRIGRKCQIDDCLLNKGNPLIVEYPERSAYFRTSNIVEIEETDRGIWVTTLNSQYRFDILREVE